MLVVAALTAVLAVTPAFHFPTAEVDTSVTVDASGPFLRLNGVPTRVPSASKPSLHRVDDHRFVLVDETYARLLYDGASGTVTNLVANVSARPVNGVLVLLLLSRIVCDVDPSRPALRVLHSAEPWASPLAFDGSRLIVAVKGTLHVVRSGQPTQVLALPEGFNVRGTSEVVRGDRVIIVREGPLHGATRSFDGLTWAKPVPWTVEVALFNVASGTFTPLGKVPGRWQYVGTGCCSGWAQSHWIPWIDAARARKVLHAEPSPRIGYELTSGNPSAVVDEWNEVITWDGPDLVP